MSRPLGLSTLGQISINVVDLSRATTFYRDALGIPFLFEVPKMAFFKDSEENQLALMSEVAKSP